MGYRTTLLSGRLKLEPGYPSLLFSLVKECVTARPSVDSITSLSPFFGVGPVATSVKKPGSNAADFLTKGDRATKIRFVFERKT